MTKTIETYIDDIRILGEEHLQIVQTIRQLVKDTINPLAEEIKYGGILFSSGVHFGGVFAYKSHVSLELSQGAHIKDLDGFLEGDGKYRRHIKLRNCSDIIEKKLPNYIRLALEAASKAALEK